MKTKVSKVFLIVLALFINNGVKANEGENLFNQNCAACHLLEGTLLGPGLKGIKTKWKEAGEEANLLLWVKNPAELYNSGNSEMAKLAWDVSPIQMTPQSHLSDDDINSIFEYIDGGGVSEEVTENAEEITSVDSNRKLGDPLGEKTLSAEESIKIQNEHDNTNRIIFILLVVSALFLVLGIVSISKTIQTFSVLKIKKQDKKNEPKKGSAGAITTVIFALVMLVPFSGYSMSFDLDKDGWLFVSNLDNILLFCVNVVLLLILLDQKKTLKAIIASYDESLLARK